jgi:hypothetical protein
MSPTALTVTERPVPAAGSGCDDVGAACGEGFRGKVAVGAGALDVPATALGREVADAIGRVGVELSEPLSDGEQPANASATDAATMTRVRDRVTT